MSESKYGTKDGGIEMNAEECLGVYSPEHLTDWLIKYHGAKESSRGTITNNIRSQFRSNRALGFMEGSAKMPELTINFSLLGRK